MTVCDEKQNVCVVTANCSALGMLTAGLNFHLLGTDSVTISKKMVIFADHLSVVSVFCPQFPTMKYNFLMNT